MDISFFTYFRTSPEKRQQNIDRREPLPDPFFGVSEFRTMPIEICAPAP
jgi:hypothetical protein